jgi:ribonuclease HI
MHLIIHTDGGARGNPGPAAAGVSIVDAATGDAVHEAGYFLGETTNNVAEYQGLLRGLARARELGATRVSVRSDSELMVRQIHGQYRVKSAALKPLFQGVMQHLRAVEQWDVEHVRRDGNKRADQLANAAMDAGMDIQYT